jgi:two-component system chemotaxis response regulator CheB
MTDKKIKVLIIDDSAFARKVIREVLERDSMIEVVGYARDGLDGIEKINELKPDVITLDLIMPDLDGLGVLKILPKENPPKVIIVSVSGSDSELALEALELGAVDLVKKPTASPTDKLYDLSSELVRKIKTAHIANPKIHNIPEKNPALIEKFYTPYNGPTKLVVLGTSTGGPQAITHLFETLPENFPVPLVIALHIPHGYTAPLAERISKNSQLRLVEAFDGMELVPNLAVIVPGGMHLLIKSKNNRLYAVITREPEESLYHPSIDILFQSAAREVGDAVIGVVLTGMGNDGMKGSQAIREAGGWVIAESSSSCVVYGMPRSVIEVGAANEEAPLDKIVSAMVRKLK